MYIKETFNQFKMNRGHVGHQDGVVLDHLLGEFHTLWQVSGHGGGSFQKGYVRHKPARKWLCRVGSAGLVVLGLLQGGKEATQSDFDRAEVGDFIDLNLGVDAPALL